MHRFLALLFALLLALPLGAAEIRYSAVTGSFSAELEAIKKVLVPNRQKLRRVTINGVVFESARVGRRRYLFFLTGMSVVNAAMTTQLALARFPVKELFFAGISGGVNPGYQPGDVVVPERWAYHDEGAYLNEREPGKFQMPEYFKPKYPNFGMMFPDEVVVIRSGLLKYERVAAFPAGSALVALAKKALARPPPLTLEGRICQVKYGGTGVSGSVFCDNSAYREFVWSTWQAECLDMESTAIAHVCWANKIPCLIVRGLSDLAGGQAGVNTEEKYLRAAAENSAKVLETILLAK